MSTQLTDADHDAGVHPVPLIRGRVAHDAAIGPEVVLPDLRIAVTRERLENLQRT